jgi:hypothetical protein
MKIALLAAVAGLALYAPAANAAVNIYISETDTGPSWGVYAEAIGSLDITGLSKGNQATLVPGSRGTSYFFSGKNGATVDSYFGLAGPDAFGGTYGTGVSASSGTPFGFILGGAPRVFLPTDYVSGAAISPPIGRPSSRISNAR